MLICLRDYLDYSLKRVNFVDTKTHRLAEDGGFRVADNLIRLIAH